MMLPEVSDTTSTPKPLETPEDKGPIFCSQIISPLKESNDLILPFESAKYTFWELNEGSKFPRLFSPVKDLFHLTLTFRVNETLLLRPLSVRLNYLS